MRAHYEGKAGSLSCYEYAGKWHWSFSEDSPDSKEGLEYICGGPRAKKSDCQREWEMLGVKITAKAV